MLSVSEWPAPPLWKTANGNGELRQQNSWDFNRRQQVVLIRDEAGPPDPAVNSDAELSEQQFSAPSGEIPRWWRHDLNERCLRPFRGCATGWKATAMKG